MPRWRLDIAYDGTGYNGWQRQPNTTTVQGTIENVIRLVTRQMDAELTAAGRTDTGVHARGQVAHVDLILNESCDRFKHRLNSVLPADVRVQRVASVDETFHARYSAVSRTYRYTLATEPDPLLPHRWVISGELDIEAMRLSAEALLGTHDFRQLSTQRDEKENTLCTVTRVHFEQVGEAWVFEITANRFLRNMVRRIMGMLVAVGSGKSPKKVPIVAPAHALVLERVEYGLAGLC